MPYFKNKNGYSIWYEEIGTGRPIIYIHGWCMSSEVWKFQQNGLSDTFRVITFDLKGHGNSTQQMDGFQIKECAEDLAELMEYLDVHDVIIAGWSLGATIAIEACLLCKERLYALILISGTPKFVQTVDFPHGLPQADADGMATKVNRNIRRALDGFIARIIAPGEDDSGLVHKFLSSVPAPSSYVALQALDALVEADMRDCISLIDIPTLIINGDSDIICLPEASEFMTLRIPRSEQIVFSECGHVPFITQSSKFNLCIKEYIRGLSEGFY
jgi:pimeloyl-[acyl-carrier protein] methyl ester esterase